MDELQALEAERLSILDEMEELNETSAKIKDQLLAAQAIKIKTGEYADPDWWRRANYALKGHRRQAQGCQVRLGDVNRQLRALRAAESDRKFERRFINAARRMLPPALYSKLCDIALSDAAVDAVEPEALNGNGPGAEARAV